MEVPGRPLAPYASQRSRSEGRVVTVRHLVTRVAGRAVPAYSQRGVPEQLGAGRSPL